MGCRVVRKSRCLLLVWVYPHSKVHLQKQFLFLFFIFTCFWPYWDLTALCGLSLLEGSGVSSSSQCRGFSLRGAELQGAGPSAVSARASVPAARGLQSAGSGTQLPHSMGSSLTRDRTGVLCSARWTPNHWTTREPYKSTVLRDTFKVASGPHCHL